LLYPAELPEPVNSVPYY